MDLAVLQAFVKHAGADTATPADYTATRAAAVRLFPKLANVPMSAGPSPPGPKLNAMMQSGARGQPAPAAGGGMAAPPAPGQPIKQASMAELTAPLARAGRAVMNHPIGRTAVGGAAIGAGVGAYRGYKDAPPGYRMSNALHEAKGGAFLGGGAGAALGIAKAASIGDYLTHGAEVAGLGVLAYPTVQKMRGKPVSERASHAAELGGLGILAAPSAMHLGGGILSKLRRVPGHA